jgi:transposase
MGRQVKKLVLDTEVRASLEHCFRNDHRHCVRQRCRMILLKSSGLTSKTIGTLTGYSGLSVDMWVRRFENSGLTGLYTKHGSGRKSILAPDDLGKAGNAVVAERQRLSQAKELIEQELGKGSGQRTLTRFLKKMTAVTNV